MRARGLLVILVALLALLALASCAAAESALLRDEVGDVALPGADVTRVGLTRTGDDARITVSYADAIPLELELEVVLQVGPAPEDVVVARSWRAPADRWPDTAVSYGAENGGNVVVEARAAFAEDAVQLTVPGIALEGRPCLELRSLRSAHHADDGSEVVDTLAPAFACEAPHVASAPQESASEGAPWTLPREARVPGPAAGAVLVGLALAAISRRR